MIFRPKKIDATFSRKIEKNKKKKKKRRKIDETFSRKIEKKKKKEKNIYIFFIYLFYICIKMDLFLSYHF